MAKNPNNRIVYIKDHNLKKWKGIENRSDFVNWCIETGKIGVYKKAKGLK